MTRKLGIGTGARRLLLLMMAAALAVLVLPGGAAERAAADGPEMHYKCYMPTAPGDPPGTVVNLVTQFGEELGVTVGPAQELCAPAWKDGVGPPLDGPHLRCYDIVGDEPAVQVNLRTQFGFQAKVTVGQAQKLCVPVTKDGSTPLTTDPHYKCYAIDGNDPDVAVDLETQFGLESAVDVGQATLLCAPTVKTIVSGPGTAGGSLGYPHLVCYTISPPPTTIPLLNTLTQFDGGVVKEVELGAADLLCVEAVKTAGLGVGGIAEEPALAEGAAEGAAAPSEGGGWSTAGYAALAGGLALAVVVLGGGAWYAVRRRSVR